MVRVCSARGQSSHTHTRTAIYRRHPVDGLQSGQPAQQGTISGTRSADAGGSLQLTTLPLRLGGMNPYRPAPPKPELPVGSSGPAEVMAHEGQRNSGRPFAGTLAEDLRLDLRRTWPQTRRRPADERTIRNTPGVSGVLAVVAAATLELLLSDQPPPQTA
jgi:hypothetical protein